MNRNYRGELWKEKNLTKAKDFWALFLCLLKKNPWFEIAAKRRKQWRFSDFYCPLENQLYEMVSFYCGWTDRLCFRVHVRCSFYHSVHRDSGGTQSPVKKYWEIFRKKRFNQSKVEMGPSPFMYDHFYFCLYPLCLCFMNICSGLINVLIT